MKKHIWKKENEYESCKNCDARRETTSYGWRYWIVSLVPTPEWMSHVHKEETIEFPVLFGTAIPKCARGMGLLDF